MAKPNLDGKTPVQLDPSPRVDTVVYDGPPPRSLSQMAWIRLKRHQMAMTGGIALATMYLMAIFAPFLAPYDHMTSDRGKFYHPPTAIHVFDTQGRLSRPFVYNYVRDRATGQYVPDETEKYPIRFFVRGTEYKLLWVLTSNLHLYGVVAPARVFLLGSDGLGRDQFSRLIFGGRVSLSIGLVGVAITTVLGMLVGGLAGYYGGVVDNILMRFAEVLMSIPSFYLLLTLSTVLPSGISSSIRYMFIVAILAFGGWAGMARVIRGQVLSLREREFVHGALAVGARDLRIIVRHVLPNTLSYVIVAATLSIPGYILGESGLSVLGLGVQEPAASWGNMLSAALNLTVLVQYPWLLIPGFAIFVAVLAYNLLGDGLRDAFDPRAVR